MAFEKIGSVSTPGSSNFINSEGTEYPVYWDRETGEIKVGNESAGSANSAGQAMTKAKIYAGSWGQSR
ncbi:hypothetical protein AB3R30_05515 [Leptolyngbyaceae cyanobacterium UHCC 1019]